MDKECEIGGVLCQIVPLISNDGPRNIPHLERNQGLPGALSTPREPGTLEVTRCFLCRLRAQPRGGLAEEGPEVHLGRQKLQRKWEKTVR